jgi:hypothetical protein
MACRTAVSTFSSDGNLTHPFFATIRLFTQTLNSPRSPSINSGCTPNSRLISSATRAALGLYDAQILQNRMRTDCMLMFLQTLQSCLSSLLFPSKHPRLEMASRMKFRPVKQRLSADVGKLENKVLIHIFAPGVASSNGLWKNNATLALTPKGCIYFSKVIRESIRLVHLAM